MNDMSDDTKIRNWNVDDERNRDWIKLLLRLQGKKAGQFITSDEPDGRSSEAVYIERREITPSAEGNEITTKKAHGKKYGRFVTIDDRVVFIGGPGSGAGGASAGSATGKLPKATYVEGRENAASLSQAQSFIEDGIDLRYSNIAGVSSEERARVKDEVITAISERSGVPYETVNEIVRKWAETSNGGPSALAVQQEAAKMFGSPLSEWQQGKIDSYLQKHPGESLEPTIATRQEIRKVLNAMYEDTQSRLADAGLPEYVTLRRGISDIQLPEGTVQNIYMNTLSSFTSNADTAKFFSSGDTIIEIQIPRSRILATARTGYGCLSESEFVVIGNNVGNGDQVMVIRGKK